MKQIRTIAMALALSLSVLAGPTLLESATSNTAGASAHASHYNYVVAPRWWGWCDGFGETLYYSNAHNVSTGARANGHGDVVGLSFRHGWNKINVKTRCVSLLGNQYWTHTVTAWVYSGRTGQAHFIGSDGGTWSN